MDIFSFPGSQMVGRSSCQCSFSVYPTEDITPANNQLFLDFPRIAFSANANASANSVKKLGIWCQNMSGLTLQFQTSLVCIQMFFLALNETSLALSLVQRHKGCNCFWCKNCCLLITLTWLYLFSWYLQIVIYPDFLRYMCLNKLTSCISSSRKSLSWLISCTIDITIS